MLFLEAPGTTRTAMARSQKLNDNRSLKQNISMAWNCHRGIMIRRRVNNENSSQQLCLCPPAYYGRLCEYQNQRISFTFQMQAQSDWHTPYAIVITLRDNQQGLIESHEHLTYLPSRDCRKKFHVYLLYTTRPKNTSKNYTVRVDAYNKHTLDHRASWMFPVNFPFLPVQPIAVKLLIPVTRTLPQQCETLKCGVHGHCSKYINANVSFCYCNAGWSGLQCDIQHICRCSSDSLCLDSQICVCPLGKFGPRCYLKYATTLCENGEANVPDHIYSVKRNQTQCICPEGFSGSRCEVADSKITISFESNMPVRSLVSIHFIEVFGKTKPHIHTTALKRIPFDTDAVTVFRKTPFHIVFAEVELTTYYLVMLRPVYVQSTVVSVHLTASERCASLIELFNTTFIQMHLLRRMKYYHIPCRERMNLACFYDERHMCICNHELQQANCFVFNRIETDFTCKGTNLCENDGYCFYDDPHCPSAANCVCNDCSYGSRCQFSTKDFSLSLETILGYRIRPNESLAGQRTEIKVTIGIITFMLLFGVLTSTLSILTLQASKAQETGSRDYLLVLSYVSVCAMITFAWKFFHILGSQMALISNRHYLLINCI